MDEKKAIDKAIDLWERVVQLNPTHLDALFLLARAGKRHTYIIVLAIVNSQLSIVTSQ